MKIKKRFRRGFTIVEIMIVIVIIGILATVVAISYNGISAKARDASVLSDLDHMDALQTSYGLNHNTAGKAYYSGNGPDTNLGFTASSGNVIDVVINSTDYCIRGYNPNGTKNSINNAYIKESTPGVCSQIPPSGVYVPTITIGAVTSSSVSLSWTSTPGATGYTLQRDTSSSFATEIPVATQSGTTFNDSGLSSGTTYYYRVDGTGSGGTSGWSTTVNVTTAALNVTTPLAPTVVATTSSLGTVAYLTSGTSYLPWLVPPDWNNANNKIECIGGGGETGLTSDYGGGGGGGGYSRKNNLSLTPGSFISYFVAGNGASSFHDTYFNGTSLAASSCGSQGGAASGGAGGSAANGVGDVKYSGGLGEYVSYGGGGGGAAGPNGNGNGGSSGTGGSGDVGFGGIGGSGLCIPGANGTEWDATHGSGGGGSQGPYSGGCGYGGAGGLYGGGGGKSGASGSGSGIGAPGLIVITSGAVSGVPGTTTYSWNAATCAPGTTASYQYDYTITPAGFDSGWVAYGTNLSIALTTSTQGQNYAVAVQANCSDSYTTSAWSTSGSASYHRSVFVDVLAVGGGGKGGDSIGYSATGSGGGAGGYQYIPNFFNISTSQSYPVTVGLGGTSATNNDGQNSTFSSITALGGGGGSGNSGASGHNGGSGGGEMGYGYANRGIGSQGYDGGYRAVMSCSSSADGGSGGGGAGGAGGLGGFCNPSSGNGGSGVSNSISGTPTYYGGGGGGGGPHNVGNGGSSGGIGGGGGNATGLASTPGQANTGGGGSGGGDKNYGIYPGGNGGSGIVIIRYLTGSLTATGGNSIVYTDSNGLNPRSSPAYSGGYTVHTFTSSGTFSIN